MRSNAVGCQIVEEGLFPFCHVVIATSGLHDLGLRHKVMQTSPVIAEDETNVGHAEDKSEIRNPCDNPRNNGSNQTGLDESRVPVVHEVHDPYSNYLLADRLSSRAQEVPLHDDESERSHDKEDAACGEDVIVLVRYSYGHESRGQA